MKIEKEAAKKAIVKHLFDFFMLFLAVSLGFIADNYRDEKNSNKLAKDLASDVMDDIRGDTAAINDMLFHCHNKKIRLDSLFNLVNDNVTTFEDTLIYKYTAFANKRPWFDRHGTTTYLLLNAGYLSYFSKDASVAISTYDLECQKLISLLQLEKQTLKDKIDPFLQEIFHTENFVSILNTNTLVCKPELHNWTRDQQWLFHNYITEMKILNNTILLHYQKLMAEAIETLRVLNKEYFSK